MNTRTILATLVSACLTLKAFTAEQTLRPPAVPLVTHDPYFSIWSFSDRLVDDWPVHWTGKTQALSSMVRVDGKAFRLIGPEPQEAPAAVQRSLRVLPTRTIYQFEAGGVLLTLTFTTPLLPADLNLVGRPVTYLTWTAEAANGRRHRVVVYYDNTAEPAVDVPEQKVTWSRPAVEGLDV
ncbi:MAG: DUF5127 domain-containing protein, partial [Planctomycetota bacterium]